MANKRIVRMQIDGSKKNFDISLDALLHVLRYRKYTVLQLHHASETFKLMNAMEKEAEATLYNSYNKYDVEYDI